MAHRWKSDYSATIQADFYPQIHGPKTLKALTLVCRAFCTIFSPLLHAHFTINLSDRWLTYLKTKPLPAQLLYTKHFEVLIDVLREESPDENSHQSHGSYDPLDTEDYARYIAKLLDSMPNLQSFRYILDPKFLAIL